MKDKNKKTLKTAKSKKVRKRIPARGKTVTVLQGDKDNFKVIVDNAGDGIVINTALDGKIVYANKRAAEITGYSIEELLKTTIKDHASPDRFTADMETYTKILKGIGQPEQYETAIVHKDGRGIPVEMTGSVVDWRGQKAVAVIIRNIAEKRVSKERLQYLTHYDGTTGLINRARLIELLDEWISNSQSGDESGVLILIDLDQFKYISDTFGCGMGDEFLRRMARLLQTNLRYLEAKYIKKSTMESLLCRLSGDEFAIFLPSAGVSEGALVAEHIRKGIEDFYQPDVSCHLTASIGVAVYPDHAKTTSDLLTKADISMFRAKELGRNRCHIYSSKERYMEHMHSRLISESIIV